VIEIDVRRVAEQRFSEGVGISHGGIGLARTDGSTGGDEDGRSRDLRY
jgi:hypothetical protein